MYQKCGIQEKLRIDIFDKDGNLTDYRETYNSHSLMHRIKKYLGFTDHFAGDIVLDAGLADVAAMIGERYNFIAVGTGTTAPEHDDTELETEVFTRVAAASSLVTTFYTNDTVRFTATFTPTYDASITEAAICVASNSGLVFARETFVPFSAVTSTNFSVSWDVVVMR